MPRYKTEKMNRTLLVDILSVLFGIGTWVCVNGLWVELPLLVNSQPEQWKLPSYMSVVIQLANIGPLSYSILNSFFPKVVREKQVIYLTMTIGCLSTILLAFFWDKTTYLFGEVRSTALLALVFCLALVDCSSRVLFLPFMAGLKEMYLTSFFIGEGLSGFVPALFALIQGVGGNPECRNVTQNATEGLYNIEAVYAAPRFSVEVFFYLLFGIMVVSMTSFHLLNYKPIVKDSLNESSTNASPSSSPKVVLLDIAQPQTVPNYQSTSLVPSSASAATATSAADDDEDEEEDTNPVMIMGVTPRVNNNNVNHNDEKRTPIVVQEQVLLNHMTKSAFLYLLTIQLIICTLSNGVFPSIQSYSCLPYGNEAYHWAVTLSSIANPAVCFLAFYTPPPTKKTVSTVTVVSFLVASYVLTTALLSPTPPLQTSAGGEILLVLSWILLVGFFTYVKVSVALILRSEGRRGLFWCGAVTQFGSATGAIVTFLIVNYTQLFQSYQACGV